MIYAEKIFFKKLKKGVDKSVLPCYNNQAIKIATEYRGVEQFGSSSGS